MSLSRRVDNGGQMVIETQKIRNDVKEPLSYVRYFGPKTREKLGKVQRIDVIIDDGECVTIGMDGFFLSAEETQQYTDKLDRERGPALDKEIEKLLKERDEWAAKYPHAEFEAAPEHVSIQEASKNPTVR